MSCLDSLRGWVSRRAAACRRLAPVVRCERAGAFLAAAAAGVGAGNAPPLQVRPLDKAGRGRARCHARPHKQTGPCRQRALSRRVRAGNCHSSDHGKFAPACSLTAAEQQRGACSRLERNLRACRQAPSSPEPPPGASRAGRRMPRAGRAVPERARGGAAGRPAARLPECGPDSSGPPTTAGGFPCFGGRVHVPANQQSLQTQVARSICVLGGTHCTLVRRGSSHLPH